MKKQLTLTVCAMALGMSVSAFGQQPKPVPELKRLDILLGKWKIVRTPVAAGAEAVSTIRDCEWFSGGFQMVCHTESEGGDGKTKGLIISTMIRRPNSMPDTQSPVSAAGDMGGSI